MLHFTQVVWRATKEVGCAMANCEAPAPDGTNSVWKFFVCRYSPPGNINGTNPGVLEANVPRPPSSGTCPK
jgi:pathogenesis-related protein 1